MLHVFTVQISPVNQNVKSRMSRPASSGTGVRFQEELDDDARNDHLYVFIFVGMVVPTTDLPSVPR